MRTQLRHIALFVICFVSFQSFSQLGYLGKRVGLELGVTSNFPIIGNTRDFYTYTADEQLLLPKVSLGLHRENKKGTVVHWQVMYNQLPNSQVSFMHTAPLENTQYTNIDTVWTKSDNIQFSLGYRKFRELAQIGLYFELQFEANVVFNRSLFYSEYLKEYPDINYYENQINYEDVKKTSLIPEVALSIGATYPLNDAMLLDYGGRLNVVFGKFRDRSVEDGEFSDASTFHRIVSSRKLFANNFLEFYVNIILFP